MQDNRYRRQIYLEDKPKQQALTELLNAFEFDRKIEYIPTAESLGRITALPIYANLSQPHYHASAMDGIAVTACYTYGAHEDNPIQLKLSEGQFTYVDTGNPILAPFDAVIMIENVHIINEDTIEIIEPATPWQHIRPIGEDVVTGEMLLPQGHKLRPVDLGALLAGGVLEAPVVKKPNIVIIPTGNEIVSPSLNVQPGEIIETNGTVFASYAVEWGGCPHIQPIVKDDPDLIRSEILNATKTADIVIINAGSSAGSKDYTVHIINEIGTVLSHGVATRPGKPVVLGKVNDTIVVGLPGYPVSAYLAMEWFVRPLISKYLGISETNRETLSVKLGRRIVSNMGSEDFVRMNIGYVNGQFIANPLTRAAGVTMSMVRADGLLVVPADSLGLEQGEEVDIELYKPVEVIEKSILFSGSHDLTIDIISSLIRARDINRQIISSHTGSMAGLIAIKKGEAHIAGIHLLDPETGEYNLPFISKYLKGENIVLLRFLKREQGWIVPKGNPYEVKAIEDLKEKQLHFVNRQKGAGTRILFDHLLKKSNISSFEINGYQREMFSHLSVAAEVKQDNKSVGLGIYSAAKAMDLDFIPLADESYDLLMTRDFYESEGGRLLESVLRSEDFATTVAELGGYKVDCDFVSMFY
ncbi:molybdopterin biosynthesis protein [Calidifontibacillus oryziterrae]|uniref:molybdopterin biosynthesis protein n=1 Tax=Calidifontibacillus oryziterrae TaxID=1191699 RepID=UPI000551E2CE|nr:molybdopterin biosynthesis protein [Calidifontibacillus oryziterrae]